MQRRGMRRGKEKYFCPGCGKWQQINRAKKPEKKEMLLEHLEGNSYRTLSRRYNVSVYTAHNWCKQELKKLPQCVDVTREVCNRFSGQLLVDGKYVKVKQYERKIPVIYGVDYLSHDIPHYLLTLGENYESCVTFFQSLRLANYPLQAVICDDNQNIYEACKRVYPEVVVQLCQNHYKENVRQLLGVRREETPREYKVFMKALEVLFSKKRSKEELEKVAGRMVNAFSHDPILLQVLTDLQRKQHLLFGYQYLKGTPTTTNLIESLNSHLQGRLETIKGFESFQDADLWLNGYFLHRRVKPYTDCSGKFRRLNGKTSLSQTLKRGLDTPTFFT